MNNNTVIEITGCMDCPLRTITNALHYWCEHPEGQMYLSDDLSTPSNCPLYKQSLTISIKK